MGAIILAVFFMIYRRKKRMKTTIIDVFWPDWRRATIWLFIFTGVTYFIMYDIQRSVFGVPVYSDMLTPWIGYMPYIIFHYTGSELGALVLDIISLVYFWVVASITVWIWDSLKARPARKKK